MAVDIGAEAIDRPFNLAPDRTGVNKEKPASVRGWITSIDIWASATMTGLRVGTFYVISGNTLKCRDSEAIAGTITAGEKVTKAVSIAVEIGDYIGFYVPSGRIIRDIEGYAGLWFTSGEYIDPGDEVTYGIAENDAVSLGGYIELLVITPVADGDLIGIGIIRKS